MIPHRDTHGSRQGMLTPVMENLSVRVASTGAFGGLLSGSMDAFGTFTGAACLPGISCSDSSACTLLFQASTSPFHFSRERYR